VQRARIHQASYPRKQHQWRQSQRVDVIVDAADKLQQPLAAG
jgi:hypothetical protein